jgi:ketosteroid isomerase-like protein
MWRRCILLVTAAAAVVGCATGDRTGGSYPDEQAQVRSVLMEVFSAGESKDFALLDSYHWYGPKFTKFGSGTLGREDAEAARQGEHQGLSAISGLSMKADDVKIDLFGDVAIATFIMNSSFNAGSERVERKYRSTLVFVKREGNWKITHEHFSPFQPAPAAK